MKLAPLDWVQDDPTHCLAIAYTLIDTDTMLTADSIFSVASATNITVQTALAAKTKIYNLRLIGTVENISN